jgi:hypothetical protein
MPTATVLSICPFETIEIKPIARGYFRIPAAPKDDFVLMYIEESSYIQRLPATEHNIVIPVAAHHIAKSLVDDFVNTVIEATDEAGPGMMWFEIKVTREQVVKDYKDELKDLFAKQIQWFKNLCQKADDDWNQYHKLGLISGHQKYAAQYLGHAAPWLVEYNINDGLIDCPACFSKIDARAVVCIHCKAIINRQKAIDYGILVVDTKITELIKAK